MTERQLRMTYDEEADAAFIYLSDPIERGDEASSSILNKHLDQAAVVASFDKEDRLIGIELLGASRILRPDAIPLIEG
jgi:uncharacterized protein YuzE